MFKSSLSSIVLPSEWRSLSLIVCQLLGCGRGRLSGRVSHGLPRRRASRSRGGRGRVRWARGAGLRFRPPLAACLLQEVQRLLSRGGEADALPPGPSVPTARARRPGETMAAGGKTRLEGWPCSLVCPRGPGPSFPVPEPRAPVSAGLRFLRLL